MPVEVLRAWADMLRRQTEAIKRYMRALGEAIRKKRTIAGFKNLATITSYINRTFELQRTYIERLATELGKIRKAVGDILKRIPVMSRDISDTKSLARRAYDLLARLERRVDALDRKVLSLDARLRRIERRR